MKYYKLDNQVFAFEADGSQDDYIKSEMRLMTDVEVKLHINPDGVSRYDEETDSIIIDDALVDIKKTNDQTLIWEQIKELRQQKMSQGVHVKSVDKHFHTDESSFSQYAHIATLLSLGLFQSKNWKTIEGDFVELTEALFSELQLAISIHTEKVYAKAEYHKYMMLEMDDPNIYDFNTGW